MKYPEDYINQIIQGDALTILKQLPDELVNCVVTSPPYWSLRDYGVKGQLGLEKTFEEYIDKLCDIFDEVKRVLRSDGTMWLNMGDSYSNLTIFSEYVIIRKDLKKEELEYVTLAISKYLQNMWKTSGDKKSEGDVPSLLSSVILKESKQRKTEQLQEEVLLQKQRENIEEECRKSEVIKTGDNTEIGGGVCLLRGNTSRISDIRPYQRERKKGLYRQWSEDDLSSGKKRRIPKRQIQDTMLELQCFTGDLRILSSFRFKKSDLPQELIEYFQPEYTILPKNLLMIPSRLAIALQERGWILRNDLIWHKPNYMPSSANDRFTVNFEYLFFFVKNSDIQFWTNEKTGNCINKQPLGINGIEGVDWEWRPCPRCQGTGGETKIDKENAEQMGSPRARYHRITKQEVCKRCKGLGKIKVSFWTGHDYWFEQQFEKYQLSSIERMKYPTNVFGGGKDNPLGRFPKGIKKSGGDSIIVEENPQGRNKRCVWTIPTQPFPEAHFATFPEKLIETPIRAGCPQYVCKKCGKGREKILEKIGTPKYTEEGNPEGINRSKMKWNDSHPNYNPRWWSNHNDLGFSDCGCNAGWEGGIVLDPFMGAGTTAVVAKKQGKKYIGIELKQEYIDMANKRLKKIAERLF